MLALSICMAVSFSLLAGYLYDVGSHGAALSSALFSMPWWISLGIIIATGIIERKS